MIADPVGLTDAGSYLVLAISIVLLLILFEE